MDLVSQPISRRSLLRGSVLGGAGLSAAYLLGCGDGDAEPGATEQPTVAPTATLDVPYGDTDITLAWEQLLPDGPGPAARKDHSLVLADGGALLLFGGRNSTGDLADLWSYDVAQGTWAARSPDGPSVRHGHNAVWDAVNGRMLVFGGQQGSSFFNDMWQYTPDDDRWAELAPEGPLPAPRYGAGGTFSALESGDTSEEFLPGRFLVTHGFTSGGRFDDTWAFDVTTDTWSDTSPPDERPVERCLMRATWDTLRNRLVIFGGQTTGSPFLDDLWTLSGSRGWTIVARQPNPSARTFYSLVTDPERNYIVLFGGSTPDGATNDVWTFRIQDEFWRQEQPAGEQPSPRFGHDAVWLPDSSSMLVFGGEANGENLSELWRLSVTDTVES